MFRYIDGHKFFSEFLFLIFFPFVLPLTVILMSYASVSGEKSILESLTFEEKKLLSKYKDNIRAVNIAAALNYINEFGVTGLKISGIINYNAFVSKKVDFLYYLVQNASSVLSPEKLFAVKKTSHTRVDKK